MKWIKDANTQDSLPLKIIRKKKYEKWNISIIKIQN